MSQRFPKSQQSQQSQQSQSAQQVSQTSQTTAPAQSNDAASFTELHTPNGRRASSTLRMPRMPRPSLRPKPTSLGQLASSILQQHSEELLAQARAAVKNAVGWNSPSPASTDEAGIQGVEGVVGVAGIPPADAPTYRDFVRQRKQQFINRMVADSHFTELSETLHYNLEMEELRQFYGDEALTLALDIVKARMTGCDAGELQNIPDNASQKEQAQVVEAVTPSSLNNRHTTNKEDQDAQL